MHLISHVPSVARLRVPPPERGLRALPYTLAYLAEKLLTSRRDKRHKHFIGLLGDCSYTSR
jgi:hypothetical protein